MGRSGSCPVDLLRRVEGIGRLPSLRVPEPAGAEGIDVVFGKRGEIDDTCCKISWNRSAVQ